MSFILFVFRFVMCIDTAAVQLHAMERTAEPPEPARSRFVFEVACIL
jgi:hypothetical protein